MKPPLILALCCILLLAALLTPLWLLRKDCTRLVGPCDLRWGQTSHGANYQYEACPMVCK